MLIVVAVAINAIPWIAIAFPPIIVILYFVQRFYLRTSRQLRLLEYVKSHNNNWMAAN